MFAITVVVVAAIGFLVLTSIVHSAFGAAHARPKNWGLDGISCAWAVTEGDKSIVVAVIDTGIDPYHQDLEDNLWRDPAVKEKKVFGWNFVSNKPNPIDEHGHGTHIAGIIGAVANPARGSSGVAHRVTIMPIKYYSDANPGSVNLRNTIKAFNYAIDHGAKIINYSGGGPEMSEDELLALKRAEEKGILVVAAAGNDHENVDLSQNKYYPGSYRLSNMITVAALDIKGRLTPTSNYGAKTVDVGAPGEMLFSTLPGNQYGYMGGSSQATAFVTGIAVLVMAANPKLTPQQVKAIIVGTSDVLEGLNGKIRARGKVNACDAVREAVRVR